MTHKNGSLIRGGIAHMGGIPPSSDARGRVPAEPTVQNLAWRLAIASSRSPSTIIWKLGNHLQSTKHSTLCSIRNGLPDVFSHKIWHNYVDGCYRLGQPVLYLPSQRYVTSWRSVWNYPSHTLAFLTLSRSLENGADKTHYKFLWLGCVMCYFFKEKRVENKVH